PHPAHDTSTGLVVDLPLVPGPQRPQFHRAQRLLGVVHAPAVHGDLTVERTARLPHQPVNLDVVRPDSRIHQLHPPLPHGHPLRAAALSRRLHTHTHARIGASGDRGVGPDTPPASGQLLVAW